MTKIDSSCIYVPSRYIGKKIVFVEEGRSSDNGSEPDGLVVNCPEGGGWVNHLNKVEYGKTYDIYQWYPREKIGTAKYGDNYSSGSSYQPEKRGCWSVIWKIIKWVFIIFIIIIVLALIFSD